MESGFFDSKHGAEVICRSSDKAHDNMQLPSSKSLFDFFLGKLEAALRRETSTHNVAALRFEPSKNLTKKEKVQERLYAK